MSKKIPDFTDSQFFYRIHQQYGTGIEEYDEIEDCIISLLRVQADHTRNSQQESESTN